MNFQNSNAFNLLDFLSHSLGEYLQRKMSFLEDQITSSPNQKSHFELVLEFSFNFIDFVKRILLNNCFKKPENFLHILIEENFLNGLNQNSNLSEYKSEEKPISYLLRVKVNKISTYKFQMVMRFMFLKNLFEAEMLEKNKASSSKKQIVKKELIKLLDLVRISMQNEEENFTEFYLSKIFENVKDSKSLNFHNFLIELAQICELPDEIHDICKENLEALKRKPTTKIGPIAKIPENVLSFIQNNNLNQNDQNSTEKTMSTLMTEDFFKYSFPHTSLSSFIEKEHSEPTKIVLETTKNMKKTDSPSKTSFSLDPTRKKIFSDITKNNLKNKSDHQFLINQAKCNTNLNNIAAVQIPEETDSRSSSMVSSFSIHNLENTNKNLNNSMVFNKPKNVRSFGTTFGRKIIQLPGSKRNMKGGFQKKNHSIFDHFINEVNEKLMERQLSKETGGFFQKSLNMKVNEDDESSDLPDFLSWNNVVAFNTPIKEEYINKNFEELEIRSFTGVFKEIN